MKVEKSAQIDLNSDDLWLLRNLAVIANENINDNIRRKTQLRWYSFSEMQRLAEFARQLVDL